KGHFAREYRSPKDSKRNGAAEPQRRTVPSFQREEEPANFALMAFSSSSSSSDNEIVPSFVQSTEQVKSPRHSIQHVETSIPAATPKPANYDYHENKMAQPTARNHAHRGNHKHYAQMTHSTPKKHMVPAAVLTQFKPVPITAVRPVSTADPKTRVTRPKQVKPIVTKPNSPKRRHITRSPSPKGKWEWRPKCPILDYVSRNTSASMTLKRFDYNDALGRSKSGTCPIYLILRSSMVDMLPLEVTQRVKNSVLFTDTEYLVLSPDFKLPDESQVLLRVPRENNMYNVNLKNIVISGDLTCLFAKATLDESNIWHRRLYHINFKTMNKLIKGNLVRGLPTKVFENDNTWVACKKGKQYRASCKTKPVSSVDQPLYRKTEEESDQKYVLFPVWSSGFTNPQNTDGDDAFDGKEPKFDEKKPEYAVNASPSTSAQSKKQDDKTKREAKGKNMPELEDNTYSDDVGVEAEFNNLEASITVSPIPITRVYKNHHVTQIIGDLSLATQTRSMTRVVKDQDGLTQMFNDDFHTCMFACFLSQEEPKRKVWILVDLPYGKRAIESDESWPPSSLYDRFQSSDGYHAVPPPYTGTFMPPKPDLFLLMHPMHVRTSILDATPKPASPNPTSNGKRRNRKAFFVCKSLDHLIKDCDYHEKKMAQPTSRNHAHMGTHKHYALMTHLNPQRHMVPVAVLTQSKPVSITAIRPVSTAIPKTSVTRPKQVQLIVTKTNSPIRRHLTRRPSPKACNLPPRVTAVKAPVVNTAQDMHGKWEWRPKCPFLDHVSQNKSASMTIKRFDYNDALGRSKSVMAWVPKRI
nr:putative ribonuclease H-like domain-containing protein [Tanacetum cinerariifolium]